MCYVRCSGTWWRGGGPHSPPSQAQQTAGPHARGECRGSRMSGAAEVMGGDMSGLPLNCAQGTAAVLARWRGVLSKPLSGATGGVGTGGWLPGMPQATHSTDCVRVHVHACACPCVDRRVCTGVHRCVRARVCRPFSCYVPSLGRFEVETQSRPSWHLTVFIYFANQPFDLTFYSSVWVMFSEPLLC